MHSYCTRNIRKSRILAEYSPGEIINDRQINKTKYLLQTRNPFQERILKSTTNIHINYDKITIYESELHDFRTNLPINNGDNLK